MDLPISTDDSPDANDSTQARHESGAPTRPVVTVLIAAYNAEAFIGEAIESALAQKDILLEVLIVDDASTDATREVAGRIAARDMRVRILSLPTNTGPSHARNTGLQAARGDWIAVLDADDIFLPGRLRHLFAAAEAVQADIAADNFQIYDAHAGRTDAPVLAEHAPDEMIDLCSFVAHARPYAPEADFGLLKPMFRRHFLEQHRLRYAADIRHGEDFLLIFECLMRGARYVLTRRPGYRYTSRSSGRSRTRVDYQRQVRMAVDLARSPLVAGNSELVRLLRIRAAALRRPATEHKLGLIWSERSWRGLVQLVATDRHAAGEVARKATRRLLKSWA